MSVIASRLCTNQCQCTPVVSSKSNMTCLIPYHPMTALAIVKSRRLVIEVGLLTLRLPTPACAVAVQLREAVNGEGKPVFMVRIYEECTSLES